ncbi:glycosyltransferase family 9 protein [soil metagenome]
MQLNQSHVLICRTDNIGDVVLTLPLAGYLKQQYPGMTISFLCRAYAAPMVRFCEAIDFVVEVEKIEDPIAWFTDSDFDIVLFARPDKRLARAAKKGGIRQRVGTSHRLYHWLYCNLLAHFSRVKSDLHEAQLNFKLLKPLGIDFIPRREAIPALYRFNAPAISEMRKVLQQNDFNLILHPKSNGNAREWPIAHYTELARLLSHDTGLHIWITGSEAEGKWLQQHATALLQMTSVTSVCGEFGLGQLASFIQAADGLIACSTGPLHVSAALGKRSLGFFSPRRPMDPGRWGPLGSKAQVLCQATPCAHCKDEARCTCLRNLTPAQVAEIVLQWRAEKASLPPDPRTIDPNTVPARHTQADGQ